MLRAYSGALFIVSHLAEQPRNGSDCCYCCALCKRVAPDQVHGFIEVATVVLLLVVDATNDDADGDDGCGGDCKRGIDIN